ncbi:SET and MYND domain-containing protein 4 [Orussus abietinus]|uniref:SET and MYND domain-containing protein 4 n=1 Tax=Orussus abietinus TaxID=222816 RepID=UPI000C71601B|nr:SET and MYND domain-containing protein 4 [Orussus abietinus]
MDTAKQLILTLKKNNRSHVGYGLQKESEALMRHILQNMAKSELPILQAEVKNEEDSVKYREEGNQHFVSGDDIEAMESYTKSLAYADSEELKAYAHANRSAALYRKQMYKECLIDIDAAISYGYPQDKRKKLKQRGEKAMEEIKKALQTRAIKDVPVSGLDISDSDLSKLIDGANANTCPFGRTNDSTTRKFPLIRGVDAEDDRKEKGPLNGSVSALPEEYMAPESSGKPRYVLAEGPPKVAFGPSEEAPASSSGVRIVFNERYGRHLVATKQFKPGDVVTVEDPYAYIVYTEKHYTHCHHCLSRSYNLISCPQCPIAQYCSEECRKAAWKTVHRTECPITALLSNLLNVDKDKMRMLTKILRFLVVVTENGTGIDGLQADTRKAESNPGDDGRCRIPGSVARNDVFLSSDNRTAGFTDEGILDSKSARSALSLATNMTTRPLIGISAFACISALATILLATQTDFFGKGYEVHQLRDIGQLAEITFCSTLMLRACVIMSSNCFSIQPEPGIKSGSGLYVCHSLYNHSCTPNTFRHFEGLTMITRALHLVRPGDQIFTSYGAGYAFMTRPERKRKIMEEYFFDCTCPACVDDWPTYNVILKEHVGSVVGRKELTDRLKPFKKRLLQNKYDIEAVRSVLEILEGEVSMPCEEIVHAIQYLKSYYLGKLK